MGELDSKLWHLFPYGEAQVELSSVDVDDQQIDSVRNRYSKLLCAITQPDTDEQEQVKE